MMAAALDAPAVLTTLHSWEHHRRGAVVTSAYLLDHADPSCPDAATGTVVDAPAEPGWPCGSCYAAQVRRRVPTVEGPSVDPRGRGDGPGHSTPTGNPPSDAQVRYLTRLVAEAGADIALITDAAKKAGQWNPRGVSKLIDAYKALAAEVARSSAAPVRANRHPGPCADCGQTVAAEAGSLTKGPGGWEVRHVGGCPTVAAPAAPAPSPQPTTPAVPLSPGMYRDPASGSVWKVQAGRDSGNLYAKVLRVLDGGAVFDYDAGAIRRIRPEWRMTLEEAAEFGRATGVCCCCGRELTNPASIEAGIGPICAAKF